ncbi:uncharacterized protein LOC126328222 [Schistocerca gregaria]|uniref:uncharacterized protein LOC126328222 n=1 Tax=Schistocerca gregaria TaxID=7010 RepID=UPI00211F0B1E|nr:uncharacterized protein LOC126328222 [Schistocerca gregaria]
MGVRWQRVVNIEEVLRRYIGLRRSTRDTKKSNDRGCLYYRALVSNRDSGLLRGTGLSRCTPSWLTDRHIFHGNILGMSTLSRTERFNRDILSNVDRRASFLLGRELVRSYATKNSSDIFVQAFAHQEQPRIPIPRPKQASSKMRSRYRNRDFLESVAHRRQAQTSIRKLYPICRMIKRAPVDKALRLLDIYPQKAASFVREAVICARNNAVHRKFHAEDLYIARIVLGRGPYLKRLIPHSKGRAGLITIPYTHISVFVRPRVLKPDKQLKDPMETKEVPVEEELREPVKEEKPKRTWWPFSKK